MNRPLIFQGVFLYGKSPKITSNICIRLFDPSKTWSHFSWVHGFMGSGLIFVSDFEVNQNVNV